MEITFKVEEKIEDIVREIYNGVWYDSLLLKEKTSAGWDVVLLHDKNFDSWATAYVHPDKRKIEIETAWSGFKYAIYDYRGETKVCYRGAYRGLLAQNLMPKLTPVNLADEKVQTSLKKGCTFSQYEKVQESFQAFKKEI